MRKQRALSIGILFLFSFFFIGTGLAATINANSCSQANVQAAINSAVTGDTIAVPSGSCTWSSGVSIPNNKKITLQGAGMDSTVITRSTQGTAVSLSQSGSRVTGIGFIEGSIKADGYDFRVDHCRISLSSWSSGISVMSRNINPAVIATGLIDNNEFYNMRVLVSGTNYMLYENVAQHGLWPAPLNLGTADAVYIEDNSFTNGVNAVDGNYGGRYVFRYNTLNDVYIEAHSVQATNRAIRKWEIYNNTINQVNKAMWVPMFLRGGTGVVFNNTLTGSWTWPAIVMDNIRSCSSTGAGHQCNGGSNWDGNEALDNGAGTHTGSNGASALTDFSQSWTTDEFVGIYIYNLADGSKGQITANTATTVTATLSGGTDNDWDNGDEYKITNGYPCRDQIGRSTDEFLWTDATPYPPQAHEPAYAWNNKHGENDVTFALHNCALGRSHLKSGRDYFNNVQKPGYIPYKYPHPLRKPFAPQNLRITE